jgi:hypothetical protein
MLLPPASQTVVAGSGGLADAPKAGAALKASSAEQATDAEIRAKPIKLLSVSGFVRRRV